MGSRALRGYSTRQTPQSKPIPGSSQVPNSAGGFAWEVDKWTRLERFLILGSEGGTYYVGEQKLTEDNVDALRECMQEDGLKTVSWILGVSEDKRAPRNDQALFALAYCMTQGDVKTRQKAANVLPQVARIGTHLFQFMNYLQNLSSHGLSPVRKRAIQNWYLEKSPGQVAYQAVKYRQREGWTHEQVLRMAKPPSREHPEMIPVFNWITGKDVSVSMLPPIITGFKKAQVATTPNDVARLIKHYQLTWEMVPTEHLNYAGVWEALLENMPVMATIRQLPKMTSVGLLKPFSPAEDMVIERLQHVNEAGVHPFQVLVAMRTYAMGHGQKGKLKWTPSARIVDVLDDAFYASFKNVEPTGKLHVVGIDCSASMYDPTFMGPTPSGLWLKDRGLSPMDVAACMAMVTVRAEPKVIVVVFSDGVSQIVISPKMRLDHLMQELSRVRHGGTDCALPILEATDQGLGVDMFAVYTDNETWAGNVHPEQALKEHRNKFQNQAKLAVVAAASNEFSIADPNDSGMMDFVGFDTNAPAIMADFARS